MKKEILSRLANLRSSLLLWLQQTLMLFQHRTSVGVARKGARIAWRKLPSIFVASTEKIRPLSRTLSFSAPGDFLWAGRDGFGKLPAGLWD